MPTPRHTPILLAALVAAASSGCAALSARGGATDGTYSMTAKENYDKGMAELKSENWIDAIKYFQFTRQKFSFSQWATLAELAIADANLGRERYPEAIDGYHDFAKNHPLHDKVRDGYVAFKVTEAFYRQIPGQWFMVPPAYEKDQGPVRDALRELVGTPQRPGFIENYPSSPYVAQAKKWAADCTRRLAEHELYVANFYLDRKKPRASVGRLEGLLREYPHSAIEPDVLLLLGRTYLQMEEPSQARRAFERLVVAYPNDYHARKAKLYIDHIIRRWGEAKSAPPPAAIAPKEPAPAPPPAEADDNAQNND